MTLMAWIWVAIGCGGCGVVGWLVGDDHGRERTNREWVAKAETEHRRMRANAELLAKAETEHRATWPKETA